MRIEFLLEESSMKVFLESFLPRVLPSNFILNENYFLRSHSGKSDLQKSIPLKIKAFNNYHEPVIIIILHDQDSNDCQILKNELLSLCSNSSPNISVLVRIVCRELESWYLGDMASIQQAYPNFASQKFEKKAKFRNPDITNASYELKRILPEFQKVEGARRISPYMNISDNKSNSFHQFASGLEKIINLTID
jgi:hypothetical protein